MRMTCQKRRVKVAIFFQILPCSGAKLLRNAFPGWSRPFHANRQRERADRFRILLHGFPGYGVREALVASLPGDSAGMAMDVSANGK